MPRRVREGRLVIPGARNIDHLGLTVPDLGQAVRFFTDVLGGEFLSAFGPVADPRGDWLARRLGVPARAVAWGALVRLGPTMNLELFEFDTPSDGPATADAVSLGLVVDEVGAARAYLAEQHEVRLEWARPSGELIALAPWGLRVEVRCGDGPGRRWSNRDDQSDLVRGQHPRGVPGAREADRIGLSVPQLDSAVAFFTDLLGAVATGRRDGVTEVRLGPVTTLLLSEDAGYQPQRNDLVGGHHIALYADDVEAAVQYLRARPDIEVLAGPEPADADNPWVYFRSPWGLCLEVLHPAVRTDRHYGPEPKWTPA
ncbi:VOC family protein [Saccharothrix sp. AJ9571]|nr:VOC family protein [Saccharothrix sp. AJ9571]